MAQMRKPWLGSSTTEGITRAKKNRWGAEIDREKAGFGHQNLILRTASDMDGIRSNAELPLAGRKEKQKKIEKTLSLSLSLLLLPSLSFAFRLLSPPIFFLAMFPLLCSGDWGFGDRRILERSRAARGGGERRWFDGWVVVVGEIKVGGGS